MASSKGDKRTVTRKSLSAGHTPLQYTWYSDCDYYPFAFTGKIIFGSNEIDQIEYS